MPNPDCDQQQKNRHRENYDFAHAPIFANLAGSEMGLNLGMLCKLNTPGALFSGARSTRS